MTSARLIASAIALVIFRLCSALLRDTVVDLKLSRLTSLAVRGFRDRQEKDLAPATVVKRLNLLASILQHAISEGTCRCRKIQLQDA